MPLNAFIVRPFGRKSFYLKPAASTERLAAAASMVTLLPKGVDAPQAVDVDFDAVQRRLIEPALALVGIRGKTTAADIAAGNIREDMFNRLLTADLVLADVSIHNPNVFYELGIRQAFRERHTFVLRSDLSDYPFDLQTDRYFAYDLAELASAPEHEIERLVDALRATIASNEPDSPVFRLLPSLMGEERGRFFAVPDEFREEVERARSRRQREVLSVLAVECEGMLWEVEGLRLVGRAQFESNFVDGARQTWETIANRYPDDVEANTALSTIYQRQNEPTRSQQALARVSRTKMLSLGRQSELRSLEGRNLKEAWVSSWDRPQREGEPDKALAHRQRAALLSPLLQLAADAYLGAFKLDLNNSYAGLNALTLLVIQTELAFQHFDDWEAIQGRPGEGRRELLERQETIHLLIAALRLAVESDRERLGRSGQVDPWFNLLESAVMCIVSSKPGYVERLFEKAVHFAPVNAGETIRRSLELYRALDIQGSDRPEPKTEAGTIRQNVERAMTVLRKESETRQGSKSVRRILLFLGLRIDGAGGDSATLEPTPQGSARREAFPAAREKAVAALIREAIGHELAHGDVALAIAAGANGGDILFHEQLQAAMSAQGDPGSSRPLVRLCLAMPRPTYVGQYVASAGGSWVERFSTMYRRVVAQEDKGGEQALYLVRPVQVFADSTDMPRWLHTKRHYNVGRRNNLWMLQHALTQAYELGEYSEITLLALVPATPGDWFDGEPAMGGVHDMMHRAAVHGIKVVPIQVPAAGADEPAALLERTVVAAADAGRPRPERGASALALDEAVVTAVDKPPERIAASARNRAV